MQKTCQNSSHSKARRRGSANTTSEPTPSTLRRCWLLLTGIGNLHDVFVYVRMKAMLFEGTAATWIETTGMTTELWSLWIFWGLLLTFFVLSINSTILLSVSSHTTVPLTLVLIVAILVPMALFGYDGWILRKLFEKEGEKIFWNKTVPTPECLHLSMTWTWHKSRVPRYAGFQIATIAPLIIHLQVSPPIGVSTESI